MRKNYFYSKSQEKNTVWKRYIEVFWMSKIFLNKEREDSIRDRFQEKVHFSYLQDAHDFNYPIENVMEVKANCIDNDMGELSVVN